jgi:tRNA(Ile)-lysidine synthase
MSQRRHKDFLAEIKRSLGRASVHPGASIVVALSGGPDSVALLHALTELRESSGYRLTAAHLNHALRGDESDRDEAFCRNLCRKLRVELIAERAAGLDLAMPNLEEEARRARHDFLHRVADRIGADFVATAHHADDQAETVLMRLLRGAGVAGLAAMAEAGPGRIIRPMLALTRHEILAYLECVDANYVVDSSNLSSAMLRNRIRRDLMPILNRDYAPGASQRLAALASEMRAVEAFLTREAQRLLPAMASDGDGLDIRQFAELEPALRAPLLRIVLAEKLGSLRRVNRDHLDNLVNLCLSGPPNGEISLPGGWRAVREYDRLRVVRVRPASRAEFSVPLAFEGITEVAGVGYAFEARVAGAGDVAMPPDHSSAVFDLAAIQAGGLLVRNFRSGDRIAPLGLSGTRKVKDVFIDRKVPPVRRERFPIVTMDNEIVWLPGLLRGSGALVGQSSKVVLLVRARSMTEYQINDCTRIK